MAWGEEPPLVVIDPGHGGDEVGAVGVDGIYEKDIVLRIGQQLQRILEQELKLRAVLTRDKDIYLPLADRTAFANARKGDLFISIHTNASEFHTVYGIETYYLDNTADQSSLKLAERENKVKGGATSDLAFMLSDLIQDAKLPSSAALAHYVQTHIEQKLSRYYMDVKGIGVKKAPFYVLVGAHMPCILIEVSFIDHPIEGRRLKEPRYQELLAQSIAAGVQQYFERSRSTSMSLLPTTPAP